MKVSGTNTNLGTIGFIYETYSTGTRITDGYFTGPKGDGAAHSHGNTTSTSTLPPYLAVTVWKRVA